MATRTQMEQIIARINSARLHPLITPTEWDRDCRTCMANPPLIDKRAIKGVQAVICFEGEEVHPWHGDDDLLEMHIDSKIQQGYTRAELGFI